MGGARSDRVVDGKSSSLLRRLARDQWVRLHGTPRITVLAGSAQARVLWQRWLEVSATSGRLFDGALDGAVRDASALAVSSPITPVAVLTTRAAFARWRTGRSDRLAAMADEGLLVIDEVLDQVIDKPPGAPANALRTSAPPELELDARSAAEAALFEALQATPATTGRFELNGYLAVRFGPNAAEIDLLSRGDQIAIEIDGYHHFGDLECYRRDRRKDVMMQTQGLFVIRVLAEDVLRDPRDAVNVVCQALAARHGKVSP